MIALQFTEIHRRIASACKRSGRDTSEITLITVSKTQPLFRLQEAYKCGAKDFGENRVQEILEKTPVMPNDCKFHMIGHLQRNKVKSLIPVVQMIHSVDSLRLAHEIQLEAERTGRIVDVLIQVNVAMETSKYGFAITEVLDIVSIISTFSNIKIKGLMTIAPFVTDSEENRPFFKNLYQLSVDIKSKNIDNVSMDVLSMGMTGDYEVAIEEGATMIRVGTGIFGIR